MFLKIQIIITIILLMAISISCVLAESADDWNSKGNNLFDNGKYEEAIKCYNKAIKLDPECTAAKEGREEAIKALNK